MKDCPTFLGLRDGPARLVCVVLSGVPFVQGDDALSRYSCVQDGPVADGPFPSV